MEGGYLHRLGERRYVSVRKERSKGDCRLILLPSSSVSEPENLTTGSGEDRLEVSGEVVSGTQYRFGPSREPLVRIGSASDLNASSFALKGRWFTHSVTFSYKGWVWEWRYGSRDERMRVGEEIGEGADSLLLLERVGKIGDVGEDGKLKNGDGEGQRKCVARLVRGPGSRTVGSKKNSGGNGGRLELCFSSNSQTSSRLWEEDDGDSLLRGEEDDVGMDEVTVVTTVLAMLKREVDYMRGWQMAAIG